ncbi:hypothetical protein [Streptococcus sanguinis]|uniref:hypothetical protein n=1 Tax=Streptococcus sanguinis TaxID=1305 RepID=UPI001D1370A2|nr:hypothetical protein [Streptococcus sanguinis]MCC3172101.1 hypothetical protein [Streptococcus sanguinis]
MKKNTYSNKIIILSEEDLSQFGGGGINPVQAGLALMCLSGPVNCLASGLFAWGFYNGYNGAARP